jgi:DNA-binding response OmpR family regulator
VKKLVYILDDEQDIVNLVSIHLEKSGFSSRGFNRPDEMFAALRKELPALLILDLMLPDADGIDICKRIKADPRYSGIPIIMLTAKREETDKVLGLELGADDYVTKPFSPRELMARVKAVLRRGKTALAADVIAVGELLVIDLRKHEVRDRDEKKIDLTRTEFGILVELAKKRGWVLSREMLLSAVWGNDAFVIDRNIDVHIRHLREKLGDAAGVIVNIRGAGYKIEE